MTTRASRCRLTARRSAPAGPTRGRSPERWGTDGYSAGARRPTPAICFFAFFLCGLLALDFLVHRPGAARRRSTAAPGWRKVHRLRHDDLAVLAIVDRRLLVLAQKPTNGPKIEPMPTQRARRRRRPPAPRPRRGKSRRRQGDHRSAKGEMHSLFSPDPAASVRGQLGKGHAKSSHSPQIPAIP